MMLAILAGGLMAGGQVWGQDDTTGLILHYTFEDVAGSVVGDESGNNHTGTLKGAAVLAEGFEGQGLACMAKADYIEAPDNINVGLTSFTFSAWVKFAALKNATRFFDWGNGIDGTHDFLIFIPSYDTDDGFMTLRYRPSAGTAYNVTSNAKCPAGQWAHVAVSFDWNGSSATAILYLDGTPVGSGSGLPYNPDASLGSTGDNYFGYSRWTQDVNGFNGTFDDIRLYNRALTPEDILKLASPPELYTQYDSLDLGDLSSLTGDIDLPAVLGDSGVTVTWTSSNYLIIDASGQVTRPEKYDRSVRLLATLRHTHKGSEYTLERSFLARVKGLVELPEHLCRWNFDAASLQQEGTTFRVVDKTAAQLIGTLMKDAEIRTIGDTGRFNVLYLGNGSGYFDMGTQIGEAIYSLEDHSILCYFRVDGDYTDLASPGNYLYAFSNTPGEDVEQTGYVTGRLNVTGHQCTKYSGENGKMELALNSPAGKGTWHHYAYIQLGDTGSIYLDGALAARGPMTQLPSADIALPGRQGTLYNWLGRSVGMPSDSYLRKTMLYDFNLYSRALDSAELTEVHGVPDTLALLNAAWAENPDYKDPKLLAEFNDLDLGDLSQVTNQLVLPAQGYTYPEVSIRWSTTNAGIIDTAGTVIRPDYFDYDVTLTAILKLGLQTMVKIFPATVLANEGTSFSGDLLVRYDFSNAEGPVVKDVAEKQFEGTLKSASRVVTLGTTRTGIYNVLSLGNSSGHFDMGTEVGKVISRLDDYTLGAYYRIDESNDRLTKAGNHLWTFSNSENALADRNGYIAASLTGQSLYTTPGYFTEASGHQSLSFSRPALKGNWHHLAYTQKDSTGTLYVDGIPMASTTVTNLPSYSLKTEGMPGTPFNWIGRSCYTTDTYLRNTLVYDFRLYKRALTDEEILETELNVAGNLARLEAAYKAYVGDSITHETEIPEIPEREKPSLLEIVNRDHSIVRVGLTSLEKISFTDTQTRLTLHQGITNSYETADILKMLFDSGEVSVFEVPGQEILLYPNPASDYVILKNIDPDFPYIQIFSVSGQPIINRRLTGPEVRIDISRLPKGIYVVRSGNRALKFSKQ